jgi:endonuclease/exonuclease/phosphatase (EEP) superfamily protein YafD
MRWTGFIILILCGCFHIPAEHLVVSRRGDMNTVNTVGACDVQGLMQTSKSLTGAMSELDSNGFSLLNWNIIKGKKQDFENDFERLMTDKDLITIQEAYLTEELQKLLRNRRLNWDLSTSYEYNRKETGVLTASKAEPNFLCMFRGEEPFIKFPKTILITRYSLSQTAQMLLVANVHLINFSLSTSSYRKQLLQMERVVANHQGPLIITGDFNTWSEERTAIIEVLAKRLKMKAVQFRDDNRALVFGRAVDHIFYRGLALLDAAAFKVTSSDHNPMLATFALSNID